MRTESMDWADEYQKQWQNADDDAYVTWLLSIPDEARSPVAAKVLEIRGEHRKRDERLEAAALRTLDRRTFERVFGLHYWDFRNPFARQILSASAPGWFRDAAQALFATPPSSHYCPYDRVQEFIRRGIIDEPPRENYVLLLMTWPAQGYRKPKRDFVEEIATDPEILERQIWWLFEYEGISEINMAQQEQHGAQWAPILIELSQRGAIDRDRLLDASLDALDRDFLATRANWFSRFHEKLGPSLEEANARVGRYIGLLAASNGATVNFALRALKPLAKSGRVDPDDLIAAMTAVMTNNQKSIVEAGLRLLIDLGKFYADQRSAIAQIALLAMPSQAQSNQKLILRLLKKLPAADRDGIRTELMNFANDITPSMRPEFAEFLPEPQLEVVADMDEPAPPAKLIGDPITPVADLEELLYLGTELAEAVSDIIAFERFLDGACRLIPGQKDLWRRLAGPLEKRASQTMVAASIEDPVIALFRAFVATLDGVGDLPDLLSDRPQKISVNRGLRPGVHEINPIPGFPPERWLQARLRELRNRIWRAVKASVLAFPTHAPFWVAPDLLIERLRAEESGGSISDLDLSLALARLPPAGRSNALEAADGIDGAAGEVVRCALGGPSPQTGRLIDSWLTAIKVSASEAPAALRRQITPNAAEPFDFKWRYSVERHEQANSYSGKVDRWLSRKIVVENSVQTHGKDECPLLIESLPQGWSEGLNLSRPPASWIWLRAACPAIPDYFYAHGFATLTQNIDWVEVDAYRNRAAMAPEIQSAFPPSRLRVNFLLTGLNSADKTMRDFAAEAIGAVMARDDWPTEMAGNELGKMMELEVFVMQRLNAAIPAIASVNSHASRALAATLIHACQNLESLIPKQFNKFLEQLHELCLSVKVAVASSPPVVPKNLKVPRKTRTLAAQIEAQVDFDKGASNSVPRG